MAKILLELLIFLRARKKLWLIPLLLVMLIFGAITILASGSPLGPFIYTIF
jgi:hypothetical protein